MTNNDIPKILYERVLKLEATAVLLIALGIAAAFLGIGPRIITITLFTVVAIIIFIIARVNRYVIEKKGYQVITGEITYQAAAPVSTLLPREKRALSYHIKAADGNTYLLPVNRLDTDLPLFSIINIYIPHNTYIHEVGGLHRFDIVYAYELVEEVSAKENT